MARTARQNGPPNEVAQRGDPAVIHNRTNLGVALEALEAASKQ